MNNNIGIFFDDNHNMNPCLIDEDIIKKVIDNKDINENFINKWYLNLIDYLKNNYYYFIIVIIIILFLLYRFHINNEQQYNLNDLNIKKNIIIDTLIKKYEKKNNVVDVLKNNKYIDNIDNKDIDNKDNKYIDNKDIEYKQKKILYNLNKLKKKKKNKIIDNFDNKFSNYYYY